MTVDPGYLEVARAKQQELLAAQKKSAPASAVGPIRLILAEYQFLGFSVVAMHKFAEHVGIKITYSSLHEWVRRNLGNESGPTSQAADVLRQAAATGEYFSPYLAQGESSQPTARSSAQTSGPVSSRSSAAASASAAENVSQVVAPTSALPQSAPVKQPAPAHVGGSGVAARPTAAVDPELKQHIAALRDGMKQFVTPFERIQQRSQEAEVKKVDAASMNGRECE